jgi:leucyl aminopeptidase
MKLILQDASAKLPKTPLVAVFATKGAPVALPEGVSLPATALEDFSGDFRQERLTDALGGPAGRVLLIGLGEAQKVEWEHLRRAAALAVKRAEALKLESCLLWVAPAIEELGCGAEAVGQALAEAVPMALFKVELLKSKSEPSPLKRVILAGGGAPFRAGAKRGEVLGRANCLARELQELPGNRLTPSELANRAKQVAAASPSVSIKVLDEAQMEKLGMGSLLGVSQGSEQPAKLIHLTYKPEKRVKGSKRIALVGKGLTFDAGGISLKPSAKMEEMKYDMSGGAAVIATFQALAELGCPHEVHGVVPASENLPDGRATKPGDVHVAMNGTTIEVQNTDAEGRLILADALCYTVEKIKPDTILDVATLTGAVIIALGHELTGIFPSSDDLRRRLEEAGKATGERVWPLPLLDVHKDQMKGKLADLKNINTPGIGNGSTAGAAFLSNFVGETEWCHLDIAGTAWGTLDRDYVGGSFGTGVGVRLFLEYLRQV